MKQTRGFTLIELLVVMAIMAIVSTVILSGNAKFGGIISLRNLAYDVALTMREAQTYGISARRFSSGGVTTFSPGYGVHIGGAPATQYILFADTNESGRYDTGEATETFTISNGFQISGLCVTPAVGAEVCGQSSLDVVFYRPEPDASIRAGAGSTLYSSATIQLVSPRGDSASVLVQSTGQISVPQ